MKLLSYSRAIAFLHVYAWPMENCRELQKAIASHTQEKFGELMYVSSLLKMNKEICSVAHIVHRYYARKDSMRF